MIQKLFPGLDRKAGVLALGTQAFGTTITTQDSFKMLDMFVSCGGNILDTARLYGHYAENVQGISETVLGWWMQTRRNRAEIILSTKGAHPPLGRMQEGRLDRASIRGDIEKSLTALQTDYIDIYWLHRDDEARPVEEILSTCNELVREGKILLFGASNWCLPRLLQAQEYARKAGIQGFCATQPQWSLARQEVIDDQTLVIMDSALYAMHRETSLPVMPFSSQAKGFYYKLAAGGEESLSPKARSRFLSQRNMQSYRVLCEIAERTAHSVGALSLAYLTSQPFPVFPIVGYSTLVQAEAMREAGDITLTEADVASLNHTSEIVL